MAFESAGALLGTELSGGGQTPPASLRDNAALLRENAALTGKNAVLIREIGERDRALAKGASLAKPEAAENGVENVKARNRRLARDLYGRSSERPPVASGPGAAPGNAVARPHAVPGPARPRGGFGPGQAQVQGLRQGLGLERLQRNVRPRVQDRVRHVRRPAPGLHLRAGKGGPGPGAGVSPDTECPSGRSSWRRGSGSTVRCVQSAVRCASTGFRSRPARWQTRNDACCRCSNSSTKRSPGVCGTLRLSTATKRGGAYGSWARKTAAAPAPGCGSPDPTMRCAPSPSRSAEAARELFGGLGSPEQAAYLVCDRPAPGSDPRTSRRRPTRRCRTLPERERRPPLERVRRSLPRPLDAARRGATSLGPPTANPSLSSASAPQPGKSRRGTGAWDGIPKPAAAPLVVNNARFLILPWPGTSRPMSSPWSNGGCPTTGSSATPCVRSCSRPSAKRRASQEPATGPPARSARPKVAASSTPGANALSRSRMLKPLRRDWKRILKK